MKFLIKAAPLLLGTLILCSGCATIFTKSSYPVTIASSPSEAKVTITNKKGVEIYTGYTPTALKLKSSEGYFSKAKYQVKFEKEGYETKIVSVDASLEPWYFGNILLGGLIGMLIVDPASGAMYKLDAEFINEMLYKKEETAEITTNNVIDINEIPEEWKEHLVLIEEGYIEESYFRN
ncbi:MAG: hypothetical protein LUG18_11090 [Candidatus Azobacteroides sp.]|nr:hypothetical protein [Candidatus Azobacteroides sp.]